MRQSGYYSRSTRSLGRRGRLTERREDRNYKNGIHVINNFTGLTGQQLPIMLDSKGILVIITMK